MTTILRNKEISTMFMTIFDTEASPNFIQKDVLPTPWLVDVQPIRVNVKAAGDTAFIVKGVFCLSVKIGGHMVKAAFRVAQTW